LRSASNSEEILALLSTRLVRPEQWQAQIQALIQRRAQALVHSSLPDDVIRACTYAVPRHQRGGE
jgi:hypothetical protein